MIDPMSVTTIIDRLEVQGLVRRIEARCVALSDRSMRRDKA